MQGRFVGQTFELQGPAGVALADLSELLVFDQRTQLMAKAARVITFGTPILSLLVAMGGGESEGMGATLFLGWTVGIPLWMSAKGRAMEPGRIPYLAAMIHALCPDRRAPVQLRLNVGKLRIDPNRQWDPVKQANNWTQPWLQLNTDLGNGLTLELSREDFQSEYTGQHLGRRMYITHRSQTLKGMLRYPTQSFPSLLAAGAQLEPMIKSQLHPDLAQHTVVQHQPGAVSFSGAVQPVDLPMTAQGHPTVPEDLRWVYSVWTTAQTQTPWFSTAIAGQFPPEVAQAAQAASADLARGTKTVAVPIALAIVGLLTAIFGVLSAVSASGYDDEIERQRGPNGSPDQVSYFEGRQRDKTITAGISLTVGVLMLVAGGVTFVRGKKST